MNADGAGGAGSWEFTTAQVAEAEAVLRAAGAPARVLAESASSFGFGVVVDADSDCAFASYDLGGSWRVDVELDIFVVAMAPHASAGWRADRQDGTIGTTPVLFTPGRSSVLIDGASEILEIQFPRAALTRLAAAVYDVEYVRFIDGPCLPGSVGLARLCSTTMAHIGRLLYAGTLTTPHRFKTAKAAAGTVLLTAFGVAGSRREWRLPAGSARSAYRRAASFIEEHAVEPITAIDIATSAALPLSTLEDAFRTQTGHTIAGYLHMARVIGAHTQLVRAPDPHAAIREAAQTWGFRSPAELMQAHARMYPGYSLEG